MKKINIPVLISLIIIFISLFLSCTGINGNPLELEGTWKFEYKESTPTVNVDYEIEFVFTNNGYFYYDYDEKDSIGGTLKVNIDGEYFGEPWKSAKTLTFKYDSYEIKEDGVVVESGSTDVKTGNYYINYTLDETRLVIYDFGSFDVFI